MEILQSVWAFIGWEGLNAGATLLAVIVAIWTARLATNMPAKLEAEARSDATSEVLRATAKAIKLFDDARKLGATGDEVRKLHRIAARSDHVSVALDRLLSRSFLTDGVIIVGAGALGLLKAISRQEEQYEPVGLSNVARFVESRLADADPIRQDIVDRAQKVAKYAIDRKWPKAHARFGDVASNGIMVWVDQEYPEGH